MFGGAAGILYCLVSLHTVQPIPAIEKPLSLDALAHLLTRIWDEGDQPHFAFSISVAGRASDCISARCLFACRQPGLMHGAKLMQFIVTEVTPHIERHLNSVNSFFFALNYYCRQ
jgi:hypothetical protein